MLRVDLPRGSNLTFCAVLRYLAETGFDGMCLLKISHVSPLSRVAFIFLSTLLFRCLLPFTFTSYPAI